MVETALHGCIKPIICTGEWSKIWRWTLGLAATVDGPVSVGAFGNNINCVVAAAAPWQQRLAMVEPTPWQHRLVLSLAALCLALGR
ncbi:hypothetical protein Patl1_08489 [Pistacia atlantica]|uniref:Uncharacterized protein n=1 Tax=Pistacia atlantica TaxID=434234 RepID=A0ACC1AH01_9ROSI|nr:hypothetical protein Patl1_08489 [Pistacia atlantica]